MNVDETHEKSEDKRDIEMEEREKMLNAENKAQEEKLNDNNQEDKKGGKADIKEGMEVKPKKIPIGGIQMPGFFTRSKSKEKCKDEEQDVEDDGLITTANNKTTKEDTPTIQQRIKLPNLPNPFRKSKVVSEEDAEKNGGINEPKDRKRLLDTIRLPLISVFPRKKKDVEQGLEGQAGLASMETLDDKSSADKIEVLKNASLEDKGDAPDRPAQIEDEWNWKEKLNAYRITICALFVFALLLIVLCWIVYPDEEFTREVPIKDGKYVEAQTGCGRVEGLVEDSAVAFRGIPYARPPVGELRFKNAQPLNQKEFCWNGTFYAYNSTDTCIQIYSNGTVGGKEDCLTLDVVTPYVRYFNPLPVIVLIGADTLVGDSPGKMRPSARFARSRDVVFVRPNFRLGILGFLALETLSESDYPHTSGNYALSDILEALKWVQMNIHHFGGNKDEVTLFGHKAGATLITALATKKDAKKYFRRAWASSGSALYPKKERREAEMENKSFLNLISNCANATCLREMDAEMLSKILEDTWRKPQFDLPSKYEHLAKKHEWMVLDGRILKEHPANVWANEDLPVQLVIGTTAHSAASKKLLLKHTYWTENLVREHIEQSFISDRNLTKDVLKRYPLTYKGLSAMISDIRIVCPLLAITTQMQNVPFYVVTETRGPEEIADADADIDAILGRYEPKTPEQRRYVQAIQALFYHFVWHGRVPQSENLGKKVLIVGQDPLPNATYLHCAFWINNNVVLPYAALD